MSYSEEELVTGFKKGCKVCAINFSKILFVAVSEKKTMILCTTEPFALVYALSP